LVGGRCRLGLLGLATRSRCGAVALKGDREMVEIHVECFIFRDGW